MKKKILSEYKQMSSWFLEKLTISVSTNTF